MDFKRSILWIIFVVSSLMLLENWQRYNGHASLFFSPAPSSVPHEMSHSAEVGMDDVPHTEASTVVHDLTRTQALKSEKIHIQTDVYDADFDLRGGTLSKLSLVKEDEKGQRKSYVTLFERTPQHTYLARTGLAGGDLPNHNDLFTVTPGQRILSKDAKILEIRFVSPKKEGVQLIERYTFTRGSYVIGVQHEIINESARTIEPVIYTELVRDSAPVDGPRFTHTFTGPAFYTAQQHFQKIPFTDLDKGHIRPIERTDNGWVAMVQHYFASAWIPESGVSRDIYFGKLGASLYRVGMKRPLQALEPKHKAIVNTRLLVGPQEEKMLAEIAPGLELVKDYGWVTIIAKPLFWLLEKIHSVLGNWGWSIVMLTLLIKAAFYPLSATSYRSMARMKSLMPRLQALRERFKDNQQQMNAALMEVYRKEKVNPLGGCLPVLVQIPVFISLYWVLLASVEMRGAPWLGWIQDLSQRDPYFILPILMAASMLLQAKLNPTPPDPLQAKMMIIMPVIFSAMFFFFPAGLVLYYVVNNVLSIAQQWYITRVAGKGEKGEGRRKA